MYVSKARIAQALTVCQRSLDEDAVRALLEVHEDYLTRFRETATAMAGSLDDWLSQAVGVEDDLRSKLRVRFIA